MPDDQPTATSTDWRTDTAERPRPGGAHRAPVDPPSISAPSVTPRVAKVPPHAGEAPPPARFPLYADEYDELAATSVDSLPLPPQPQVTEVQPDWFSQVAEVSGVDVMEDERRSPIVWVMVGVLVLILAAAAWWYLAR